MIDINKIAVVSSRQKLESAFADQPIKPSTFPDNDGAAHYLIYDNQGVKDVVLDTHQSQANRVEPSFDGTGLIPDSTITVGEESINLTSVGHRVVDATVRFSDKAGLVQSALKAFESSDATPLAKLAPTSILFGMWDSRINSGASGVKVTRIFHSEIRAHNVIEVPAAGQYVSSVERIEDQKTGDLSAEGLLDVPHSGLGGVLVKGDIVRNTRVNTRAIRKLRAATPEATAVLQQYILGLALYALAFPVVQDLREGCSLVPTSTTFEVFSEDGTRATIELKFSDVLQFAKEAAGKFGVGEAVRFTYDQGKALTAATGKVEAKAEKAVAKKTGKVKTKEAAELVTT